MKIETLQKILAWERSYKQHHDEQSIIDLFQDLIDTGDIQHMEDYYKQAAHKLVEAGLCRKPVLRVVK